MSRLAYSDISLVRPLNAIFFSFTASGGTVVYVTFL